MSGAAEMVVTVPAHGVPFVVGQQVEVLLQQLRASTPAWAAAQVLNNPRSAVDFGGAPLHFGVEDRSDAPMASVNGDKPGQTPYRTYGFNLWVVAAPMGASNPREVAHAAYVKAKRLVREQLMRAVQAAGVEVGGGGLREGAVQYHLENMDLPGALVLGQFSLDYRDR
jgi:hypothetical protein